MVVIGCRFNSIRINIHRQIIQFIKCKYLLLQNVERGSRMMTKLRGTESARILHRRRDHRNASITPTKEMIDDIQKKVCLEWRDKITPHKVSRSASAHYRRSISNGTIDHHQEWKTKEIQFEKLVIQSIFPIEMILNKYFLENPFLQQTLQYFLQSMLPANDS